jgi:hypothetical protein
LRFLSRSFIFSTHPPLQERIARLQGYPPQNGQVTKSDEDRRQADAKVFWDRLSGK